MSHTVITTGPWAAMIEYAGGVQRLAEALGKGVNRVPLYRWMTGKAVPNVFMREHVNAWAEERGLKGPFKEKKKR